MMSLAIDCCCQARSAPPATQKANVITSSKVDEVEDISEIEEEECDKATEECGEEDDEVEDEENWQKVVERERKEQLMKLCAEPRVLDAAFKAALSAAAECLAPKQQPAVKAKPKMKSVETAEKKVKDDTKRKKKEEKPVEKKVVGKKVDRKQEKQEVVQKQGENVVKLTPHPPTSPPPRDPVMFLGLYFFQFKKGVQCDNYETIVTIANENW